MGSAVRTVRAVIAFSLLFTMVAAGSAAVPAASAERSSYIVVFEDSVANVEATARQLIQGAGGELGFVYQHALKGFSANLTAQAASALARNPQVAFVNENKAVHAFAESAPTGVNRIDSPTAHQAGAKGSGVRVAIIDTGIQSSHPDLQGNVDTSTGYNCVSPGSAPEDDQGHGTHVAGTVAAVGGNNLGVIGVAPEATLVSIKVLDSSGSGTWEQVICGIDHVTGLNEDLNADTDIHVVNMSLGGSGIHDGTTCSSPGPDAMYRAICTAIASGAVFVVAAGNSAANASGFVPAAYPEVITVSAFQDTDGTSANVGCSGRGIFRTCDEVFASFSNYGSIVDVIAPGVNINSTTLGGGYGTKSGTSMASPHAAGVAALVLEANPGWPAADVAVHMRATGQCPDTLENAGSGNCSGQGTWSGDPDGITEPMVNAAFATNATSGGGGDGGGGDDGGGGEDPPGDGDAAYTVSLTALTSTSNGSTWTAHVSIDVTGGASVSGSWSTGDTRSCDSTPCTVSLGGIPKRTSSVTFTVTTVADGTDFDGDTSVVATKP
jgi:subtilisin